MLSKPFGGLTLNKPVNIETEGKVLSVKLNRPEVLNAIIPEMRDGLLEAVQIAKINKKIKSVLISGEGRSFCSGGDISKMGTRTPVSRFDYIGEINELIQAMSELEKPIVAAVHGFTAGLGVSLALAADQIVASHDAKFLLSFSKVGLISDGGALFFLAQNIGAYRTKELLFNAQPLTALQAKDWGLVNRLYPADNFHQDAMDYAIKLADGPIRSYGLIKKLTNRALNSDLSTILELERSTASVVGTTEDHKEGIRAFLEKRQPNFEGE
jgi:2-(1,2-epoxy-1,2-dihydrophenyl)acetyl-CoA isomerase